MPITVDASFAELDRNLNLDPGERRDAQKTHNEVRDALTDAGVITSGFLQGSFARKTMLKPLKDVDIVCLLPEHRRQALSGPDGPGKAIESFKDPILQQWPTVAFDAGEKPPAGKALRLHLPGLDFTVDLVPAFDTSTRHVLIGDRFERSWTPSNTRIQIERVATRNQNTGGRFVHQVRELKQLTKHHPDLDFVTGIVVESLAYASIARQAPDKDAIATALRHAAHAVLEPVIEPAGEDDVTAKWTPQERATAHRVYTGAAARADEALRLERARDPNRAIMVWHSLFGDQFPTAPARPHDKVMAAWAGGSLTSTGHASSTRAGRQPAAPGRAWAEVPKSSPWH